MTHRTAHVSGLTRRRFHRIAAATAVAPLAGRRAFAFESADVVIIGAGLAGLNAALNLESEGARVIVLEAAHYVGGRTRTFELSIGPMNAGGQTIGPYYARVRDAVEKLKVPLIPAPARVAMGNYINDTLVASRDWAKSDANKTVGPERVIQPDALEFFALSKNNPLPDPESWTEAAYAKYDVSIDAFLRGRGFSDEALRLIGTSINAFDLRSGSALAYLRDLKALQWGLVKTDDTTQSTYGAGTGGELKYNEVKGGTQRLPEAMAAALKGGVRLNQPARSIEMSEDGVEVRTQDGSRFRAKYAVSAMPFAALRNIDVFPDFSGVQRDAIRRSTHGNTLRVFMEFSSPFWNDDIGEPALFTDTAIERVFARPSEAGEINVIDCWVNGNAANRIDQMPEDAVGAFVVNTLARIRPSTRGKLRVLKVHSWARHSASACCRHVFDAGQVGQWAEVMDKPHGRLHLAGEQTRSVENGMEAAAASGERAAIEILGLGI